MRMMEASLKGLGNPPRLRDERLLVSKCMEFGRICFVTKCLELGCLCLVTATAASVKYDEDKTSLSHSSSLQIALPHRSGGASS
jgi:hypothetical protein